MNAAILLIFALSISAASTQKLFKCFYYFPDEFAIYNMKDLFLRSDKTIPDYTFTDSSGKATKGSLVINVCTAVTVPPQCAGVASSLVLFVPDESGPCTSLVSSTISDNNYLLTNKEEPLKGFSIKRKDVAAFEIDIVCNDTIPEPDYNVSTGNLVVQSQDSCGEINGAALIFATHKYLLSLIFMLVGLILLTVGGYKWDTLLGTMGFLVGFGFMFFIFWSEVGYKHETVSYIIILAIAAIVGILCGYLCSTFAFLSYVLMGFAAGFFLSKYLLTTFQFSGERYVVYLIEYGSAIALATLCAFVRKYMMIIVTSITGSIMFFYSLGFAMNVLGNFFDTIERIKSGQPLEPVYYVFFGLIVVSAICGIVMQIKLYRRSKFDRDEQYYVRTLI